MAKRAIIGKVTGTKRLRSSRNGNPRFEVTIHTVGREDREFPTAPDAGVAYGIENRDYREAEHVFIITSRGNIEQVFALNNSYVAQSLLYALDLNDETAKVIADARRAAEVYGEDS